MLIRSTILIQFTTVTDRQNCQSSSTGIKCVARRKKTQCLDDTEARLGPAHQRNAAHRLAANIKETAEPSHPWEGANGWNITQSQSQWRRLSIATTLGIRHRDFWQRPCESCPWFAGIIDKQYDSRHSRLQYFYAKWLRIANSNYLT